MLEFERFEDWQRQWVWLDQRQKGDWLYSKLGENAWVLDEYRENPAKYEKMSATEALHTLQKLAVQRWELWGNQWLQIYMQLKSQAKAAWRPFTEIPAYEKILIQWDAALRQTDATAEAKTEQRWDTWKSTTWLTTDVKKETVKINLSANSKKQLDDALLKTTKEKLISHLQKKLKDWKLDKKAYDSLINYINSK